MIASTKRAGKSVAWSGGDGKISGSHSTAVTRRMSSSQESQSFADSVSSSGVSSSIRLSLEDDDVGGGLRPTTEKLRTVVVKAAESSRRTAVKQKLSSSSLAQLRVSNLKLHGREDDMALLKDELSSVDKVGQALVLVAGVSGVGKSALVARGLKGPAEKRGMAFVKGKFDLNNNALPYSAFAEALSGLARHVMKQSNVAKIRSDIQEALGDDDMEVISSAMPGCDDLFTLDVNCQRRSSDEPLRRSSAESSGGAGCVGDACSVASGDSHEGPVESGRRGNTRSTFRLPLFSTNHHPSSHPSTYEEGNDNAPGRLSTVRSRLTAVRRYGAGDSVLIANHECGKDVRTTFNKTGGRESVNRMQYAGKESVNRMQYAIRRLMKVVCSNLKSGVVMFIDDLQWSDSSSLDLLQALLQDKDIPSLLLVGAYRDDEVPESHPVALNIKEAERLGSIISKIELGNLGKEAVQNLVADALNMEDQLEKVEYLAQTVYNKTKGNPFFVIFFLKSLYDDELLHYNFGTTSWHWDDDKINEKLMTENVASIMVNKLRRFKRNAQHVIEVASCLGSTFSTRMLEIVFEKGPSDMFIDDEGSIDTATVDDAVSLFENEGLWEHVDESESDTYRFAHDQIQSAATELVPPEKRDGLKGRIGWVLFKELDPDMFDQCLFDIVSLRNCSASSLSEEDRIDLGHLNIRAGIKASNNAAFDTAVYGFQNRT